MSHRANPEPIDDPLASVGADQLALVLRGRGEDVGGEPACWIGEVQRGRQ